MTARFALFAAALVAAIVFGAPRTVAQTPPSPEPASSPTLSAPAPAPSAPLSPTPVPTTAPTPPPIVVDPTSLLLAVGDSGVVRVAAFGMLQASIDNASVASLSIDQDARTVAVSGKAPGTATVSIVDARGLHASVGVRVAYRAGSFSTNVTTRITGDPASAQYVRQAAVAAARAAATARAGAQIVTSEDDLSWFRRALLQDDIVSMRVPILIQGSDYLTIQGETRVRVENVAAPKIRPDRLLVSDYPERLEENGVLFTADLRRDVPSRFLYFHYNPPGAPDRRIVLRAENSSAEPAVVQFVEGPGGPGVNEMEVGHVSTRTFLTRLVQNEGRLIVIPARSSLNVIEQPMPARAVVSNLLQLRVLNGASVHLTLFAQNASDDPDLALANVELLSSSVRHARGIYDIPEFHYSRQWNVEDQYLELPIGQIPLSNELHGEALAGDYGVLQSFVVKVENDGDRPQAIAIYENPRGGRATGTFLIDGVLVQSHGVPAFSRYKIRQYVVPARGFVRVTIETIPEGGSSYPLRLIFAPDDGSVPPGAPGSPVY